MNKIISAFKIVFKKPNYIIITLIATLLLGSFYAYAGQVVTFIAGGVFYDFSLVKIIPLSLISILFGVAISLQIYGLKNSSIKLKHGFSGFFSSLFGLTTMSCCASLLPALLSLVGFTGSNLIFINSFFKRYVVEFTMITAVLLVISIYMASKSICAETCEIKKHHKV